MALACRKVIADGRLTNRAQPGVVIGIPKRCMVKGIEHIPSTWRLNPFNELKGRTDPFSKLRKHNNPHETMSSYFGIASEPCTGVQRAIDSSKLSEEEPVL